ncbi:MAG: ribonuclease P protein component [Clostridia bacterium]|nr:ribonuclease P protein component [Clostridia bacterium]MDD4681443.1 ribonuclease P protein component [Clostridia bacterium]
MEKKYRLRRNKDFQYTYKKGRSLGHPLLVLIYRKTRNADIRIGYSVTKKFGNAVQRNQIKRQLREILRLQLPELKQGCDIIFIVRREAKGASYKSLEEAVNQLLKRAKLVKQGETHT